MEAQANHRSRVIAVIPALNEEKYIGTIVLKTRRYVDCVIVVDDGSSDQTADVARLAGATVIKHERNKGYGAAIQTLLDEAKKREPEVVVLLDADSQHDPDDIPNLVKPILEGHDIVIGSRAEQKSAVPAYRRFGQKIISFFTHFISGGKVVDSECGFRVFSPKAISLLKLRETGMSISAETIAEAASKGLSIAETPISISYTKDSSTLNPVVHGFGVLGRVVTMISERRPLFFFGLGGLTLIVLGLIAGIQVLNIASAGGGVAIGTALIATLLLIVDILSTFTGMILYVLTRRRD